MARDCSMMNNSKEQSNVHHPDDGFSTREQHTYADIVVSKRMRPHVVPATPLVRIAVPSYQEVVADVPPSETLDVEGLDGPHEEGAVGLFDARLSGCVADDDGGWANHSLRVKILNRPLRVVFVSEKWREPKSEHVGTTGDCDQKIIKTLKKNKLPSLLTCVFKGGLVFVVLGVPGDSLSLHSKKDDQDEECCCGHY
uniref:Uncharacterized protein n=1 Tax=Timema poppense TaxID=170557 RepID=A0A7R9D8E1_TIMPO|nr:unnamed protein product [Timema poppensis]